MHFAIAQLQDVGIAFNCSMIAFIVSRLTAAGARPEEILATSVTALGLGTALLGLALVATGRLRLAGLVQYLPMPVIGGYLAFIGFFCLMAGLGVMSGAPVRGVTDLAALVTSPRALLLAFPGLVMGGVMFGATMRLRHFAILPGLLLSIPAVFFTLIWLSGSSTEGARDFGWLPPNPGSGQSEGDAVAAAAQPAVSQIYGMFRWDLVHWNLLPHLFPTWLGAL